MTVQKVTYLNNPTGTSVNPSVIEGSTQVEGQDALVVADLSTRDLLEQMLLELKKIRLLLSIEINETITDEDANAD